jgi:WD40 repeat protein
MCWVLDTAFSIHNVTASYFYDHYLYVGNSDYCIRVWNAETGQLYRKLIGHTGIITGFAYCIRCDVLFSCGIDGNIITWSGGALIHKYTHFQPPQNRFPASIHSIFFNPEAEIIVVGLDCELVTFELSATIFSQLVPGSANCPFILRQSKKVHSDRITTIIGNRRRIFSSGFDHVLASSQLLDISSSKPISRFTASVKCMIFDSVTQNLLVGDHAGVIRAFSADNLSLGPLKEIAGQGIVSMFYDSCLELLWFVLSDGSINLMDTAHPERLVTEHFPMFRDLPIAGADTTIYERILGNGLNTRVVAIVNHKYVYSWKWSETGCCLKMALTNTPVNCVFLYHYIDEDSPARKRRPNPAGDKPQGKRVGSSLVAPGINIFSGGSTTISCRPLTEFLFTSDDLLREEDVASMDFCFAEAALLCGCRSGRLRVLSLAAPKSWTVQHTDGFPVFQVMAFDTFALSLCADYSFCFWRLTGEGPELLQRRERAHDFELVGAAFCPSKHLVLTSDVTGFSRIWFVREVELKEQIVLDHTAYGPITHVCCSEGGGLWLCASADNFVRGWSVSNPLSLPVFQFCVSPCTVTALAPGHQADVYIATDDLTIRLIGLSRGEERGVFVGHTQLIRQLSVSPTASKLVSLQWDGQLYFWLAQHPTPTDTERPDGLESGSFLPRLMHRTDASRLQQPPGDEPLISLYEKSRKTLLLKRREGERSLKRMKQSVPWRRMTQIQQAVAGIIRAQEAENEARRTAQSI